jgi:RNA polymerase sigma factor (sigma-70 family)
MTLTQEIETATSSSTDQLKMPKAYPLKHDLEVLVTKAYASLQQGGDYAAFNDAAPTIIVFCHSIVSRAYPHIQFADRENIAQESLIKAWAHLGSFDPLLKVSSWLGAITRNTAIDHLRRNTTNRNRIPIEPAQGSTISELNHPSDEGRNEPERQLIEQENEERYKQLQESFLNSLSDSERAVALLRIEGLSYASIADRENIPLGTVRSRLHSIRKRL